MERNLRLYPVYQILRNSYFWLPVFFLYFLSVLSLEDAIALEAIYYIAAVLLEIPSGYFSDRVGRRLTLIAGMICGAGSALVLAATAAFLPFALAQVLRAAANAFNSGTDSALLFDSLSALGREAEIGDHESRAYAAGLFAASAACLVGGLSAGFDLRIAFGLTFAGDLVGLGVASRFAEPRRTGARAAPLGAANEVWARLRTRPLSWIFVYAVGMIVLNHVPFEFFQPYLDLLFGELGGGGYAATPAISGGLTAVMWLLGAGAALRAMALRASLGVSGALLVGMLLQLAIVAGMAAVLSAWVMLLIVGRSIPMAISAPVTNAEIHPRIPTQIRATYLSVQALSGRLVFAGCLALASRAVAGEATSHAVMAGVLWAFFAAGALLLVALVLRAPRSASRPGGA